MPRGSQEGSVELHNGKLRIQFYDEGGKRVREWTGLADTKEGRKAANAILRRRMAELELGSYEPAPKRKTFSEYADEWIASLKGSDTRSGKPFKPSSIGRYGRLLKRWKSEIGQEELRSLTATRVRAATAKVFDGQSQNSRAGLGIVCKKMLRQAHKDGLVAQPIAEEMKTPLPAKPHLQASDVWSKEEFSALPGQAAAIDPEFGNLVTVLLGTGIRGGEARALTMADVNLPERIIRIERTVSADYSSGEAVGPPKTEKSRRDVYVGATVVAALRAQIKLAMARGEPWLFPCHLDKTKPMSYWRFRSLFEKLRKVTGRDLPPHRTRHSFASHAITSGASVALAADVLGDTATTVERTYFAWLDKGAKQGLAATMSGMVDSAPIQPPAESGTE